MAASVRVDTPAGATTTFTSDSKGLHVEFHGKPYDFPWWNVLRVEWDNGQLVVQALPLGTGKPTREIQSYRGVPQPSDVEAVKQWAHNAQALAYSGSTPKRRLKVFINPVGGNKKARKTFEQKVKPVFDAAHCSLDILYTERSLHAYDVAFKTPLDFDVVVTLSGDGLIFEIFNGFGNRPERAEALAIPICPIPAGSANGLCVSLLGIKDGFDVYEAALNAIKGRPMAIDLCSITQDGKKVWSFLQQACGLMAELDIGTDHLRWMGEARFTYGYIRGLVANKMAQIKLELKNPIMDKEQLLKDWNNAKDHHATATKYENEEETRWVTVEEPWISCVAGKLPFLAKTLMQFPLALPTDGYVDLVIQHKTSRAELLTVMDLAPSGQFYFLDKVQYVKARGYRVTPLNDSGVMGVDGEPLPYKAFEVEVHPSLGRIMSPTGQYVNVFAGVKLS